MNDYFDLDGFLRGDGWELDEWGIATPPGTRNDGLHVIKGGPQHATNPHPFYFVTRAPSRRNRIWFGPVSGMEIRADGVYRLGPDPGQRTKIEDWQEAAQIRQQMIEAFGPEVARAAGIEPE